jgi:hypothetical protein
VCGRNVSASMIDDVAALSESVRNCAEILSVITVMRNLKDGLLHAVCTRDLSISLTDRQKYLIL